MRAGLLPTLAGALAVTVLGSLAAAQDRPNSPPPADQAAAPLTQAQLDRLTAPIALYPDPLVAQILTAATYPLEIVKADRWLQQPANAGLNGEGLATALASMPWDPSVKALAALPQILAMMDKYLSWTEELGNAFLAGQAPVMDSVQRLRLKAEAAGGLTSTPEEVVSNDGGPVVIKPTNPDIVNVPVYDPNVVYGEWPYPDYPPYFFPDAFPAVATGPVGIGWVEVAIAVPFSLRQRCDWRRHRIDIEESGLNALDRHQPAITSGVWQHDPAHRRGVPYPDPAVRARFDAAATEQRRAAFPGFSAAAPAPPARSAIGAAQPPFVVEGRPPAPQIVRAPVATVVTPPVVLRGTPPALQSSHRAAEMPAEVRLGPAGRVSMPAPRIATPAPGAAALAPRVAPAPRAAPAPEWMADHR